MITNAAIAFLSSPAHRYEDRDRLLGGSHPRVPAAAHGHLYAVADGVGGAPMGMRAAQVLPDRLGDFFEPARYPPTAEGLAALLKAANAEIHAWGLVAGTDRPLGAAAATVAWLCPWSRRVHVLHAGDTMAYLFDGLELHPLTREHGSGRSITRYLGQGEAFRLDHAHVVVEEGETLLLCTDGIAKGLRLHQLRDVLAAFPEPGRASAELASRARAGSKRDVTALVVELEEW